MKTPTHRIVAGLLAVALLICATDRSLANRATISKTKKDVQLLSEDGTSRPAEVGDVVSGGIAVQTGSGSATQLKPPKGLTIRLGSNSWFSFTEGDVNLKKGTLLLEKEGGFFSKTNVRTDTISAAISGTTIMIEYIPAVLDEAGNVIKPGIIKIIVIEGSLEFALNINLKEKMRLGSGEMVVFSTEAKQLPKKFIFDLSRLAKTSKLMDASFGPLPNQAKIDRAIKQQQRDKSKALLVAVATAKPYFNGHEIRNAHNRPPQPDIVPPPPIIVRPPPDNDPAPPRPVVDDMCADISGPPPPECVNHGGGIIAQPLRTNRSRLFRRRN